MRFLDFSKKNGLDADNTFESKNETSDESGLVHQRHQQYYKNLKIEFGTLITHSRNGNVISINAELYNARSLNLTPLLTPNEAFTKAIDNVHALKYLWEDEQQATIVGYHKPEGELLIFPIVKTGEVKLAYKYDIYAIEPLSRQEVYVDASNGEILFANPIIKHLTSSDKKEVNLNKDVQAFENLITGTANTKYSGVRSIETRFDAPLNMYVLNDLTRGAEIVTYNCERIVATYQNVHFKDNDNNWTLAEHNNSFFDNAAQDAHWGAEMTYDFWKNIFNRNGYDNNNAQIRSYVHYKQTSANLSNAFWNGAFMTYGDGVNKPFTSIDICGHEIGHAVMQYTAALAYQNHSGAMNEGYSDIWGACIEHFGRTGSIAGTPVANVWKIGEDISTTGLRSMSSPNSFGDPDTFHGTNWVTTGDDGACVPNATTNDHCGVHTNSGVMNHWFYILTVGKSGTNNAPIAERDTYNVTGIGMAKSAQIAYYAERDYLTPNSTYFDAREATIAVANSLYCSSSPEVVAVTNAWFAVNIGPTFLVFANDINLKSVSVNSANCGVTSLSPIILFENLGTNPITTVNITYNIDGGANSNITWNGNLPTCSTGTQQVTINISSLSVGRHLLNFTTSITNDLNGTNNTRSAYILVNQSGAINQVNPFEAPDDDLIAFNEVVSNISLWERGTSTKSVLTNAVAGNSKVYATSLTGQYPNNTKSYLMSRCYNLSTFPNPIMKFDLAFDLEYNADVLYMQYSTNGGLNWSHLGSTSNTNWYNSNSNCPNCFPGGEWSGGADNSTSSGSTNGTKQQYSYNLSAFGSNGSAQTNMVFRFVFQSDDAENFYDGAIIDNFVIENTLGLNQNSLSDFNVYPNPTSNDITITFNSYSNENVNLSLYDVQGRLITSSKVASVVGDFNYNLAMESVPTGFYLLKISQGNLNYTTKVIKK